MPRKRRFLFGNKRRCVRDVDYEVTGATVVAAIVNTVWNCRKGAAWSMHTLSWTNTRRAAARILAVELATRRSPQSRGRCATTP